MGHRPAAPLRPENQALSGVRRASRIGLVTNSLHRSLKGHGRMPSTRSANFGPSANRDRSKCMWRAKRFSWIAALTGVALLVGSASIVISQEKKTGPPARLDRAKNERIERPTKVVVQQTS